MRTTTTKKYTKISKRAHFHHPAEKHVLMIKGILKKIQLCLALFLNHSMKAFTTKHFIFSIKRLPASTA